MSRRPGRLAQARLTRVDQHPVRPVGRLARLQRCQRDVMALGQLVGDGQRPDRGTGQLAAEAVGGDDEDRGAGQPSEAIDQRPGIDTWPPIVSGTSPGVTSKRATRCRLEMCVAALRSVSATLTS